MLFSEVCICSSLAVAVQKIWVEKIQSLLLAMLNVKVKTSGKRYYRNSNVGLD